MLSASSVDSTPENDGAVAILDENSPSVRQFVGLLEKRILEGHSEAANRTWATTEMGCPVAKYEQIHAILMKAWQLAGTPAQVTDQLRNIARKRYEYLYQMAVKKEKIKEALHALDAQVKLDALDQVPEGSLEGQIGGVITNVARAKLAELMGKARELAERGVPKPIQLPSGESFDVTPANDEKLGKVIDLREKQK